MSRFLVTFTGTILTADGRVTAMRSIALPMRYSMSSCSCAT